MSAAEQARELTIAEYLAMENASEVKHEYVDGWIRSMAGGTRYHSVIKVNLIRELSQRLRGRSCQPFDSDYRISIPRRRSFFYPDASVICGKVESDLNDKNAATNPTAVFEVLSPNSEKFDKGRKLLTYRDLPALRDYVLVHQDMPVVEVYHRNDADEWLHIAYSELATTARVSSIELELPLAGLYENVEFTPFKYPTGVFEEGAGYPAY